MDYAQNTAVYNNTIIQVNQALDGNFLEMKGNATATGNSFNSNLMADLVSTAHYPYWIATPAAAADITGNYNYAYSPNNAFGNTRWTWKGTDQFTIAQWRTASSMDANGAGSASSVTGLSLTTAPMLSTSNTSYTLSSSNLSAAGGSVSSTGETRDVDGRVIAAPTTTAVGAIQL